MTKEPNKTDDKAPVEGAAEAVNAEKLIADAKAEAEAILAEAEKIKAEALKAKEEADADAKAKPKAKAKAEPEVAAEAVNPFTATDRGDGFEPGVQEDDGGRYRVTTRKKFHNSQLLEEGSKLYLDEEGRSSAIAKSTPVGNMTVAQLEQALAEAKNRDKNKAALGE